MNEFIKVFIRFRPLNDRETSQEQKDRISLSPQSISVSSTNDTLSFLFDRVFNDESQETVFNYTAKTIVSSTVDGYNSTIFSYGPTGTGKSYTMFGSPSQSGIIPRACTSLFSLLDKKENISRYEVKLSFVEIYCEQIRDLLGYGPTNLKLREQGNSIYIENVSERTVCSAKDVLSVIAEHSLHRITASTALNDVSSRSHAVVILKIIQNLSDGTATISRMNLVDLAGSENVGKSQSKGVNLVEAQMINKSLSALGNVIHALTDKKATHVPYRDSKLTFLLRDSLGGNSKCSLIATATFSDDVLFETINTLRFAQRAKTIKNDPRINRVENNLTLNSTVQELLEKIADLERKYEEAKQIITVVETKHNPPVDKQALLFKKKWEKSNERIALLEQEITRKSSELATLEQLFNTQRADNETISSELYNERIKNIENDSFIKKHSAFIKGLSENRDNPSVISVLIHSFFSE